MPPPSPSSAPDNNYAGNVVIPCIHTMHEHREGDDEGSSAEWAEIGKLARAESTDGAGGMLLDGFAVSGFAEEFFSA